MRPVAYLTGATTGHLTWPPTVGVTLESTVLANGIPVSFATAVYVTHINHLGIPHPSPVVVGSEPTVTVYGKPIGRIGDYLSCGDTLANGSNSVFAGT